MKKFLLLFIDKSFSFSPKKPFQIVKFLLAEGVEFLLIRNFTRLRRKQNFSFTARVFKNIKQFMFLKTRFAKEKFCLRRRRAKFWMSKNPTPSAFGPPKRTYGVTQSADRFAKATFSSPKTAKAKAGFASAMA